MTDLTSAAAEVQGKATKGQPLAQEIAAEVLAQAQALEQGNRVNNAKQADQQTGEGGKEKPAGQTAEEVKSAGKLSMSTKIAFRDGEMVIQIIDRNTSAVVREVPSDKLNEIREQLEITLGGTIDAQV